MLNFFNQAFFIKSVKYLKAFKPKYPNRKCYKKAFFIRAGFSFPLVFPAAIRAVKRLL